MHRPAPSESPVVGRVLAISPVPRGAYCDHRRMVDHCEARGKPRCEHYECPCGIFWDEGAEGYFGL